MRSIFSSYPNLDLLLIFMQNNQEELIKKTLLSIFALLLSSSAALTQDPALKRLNESPRHHEWVEIKYENRVVHSFVVFPEVKEKATAVLIIHETRGLTDWVRGIADQLAEIGYIAIAPDFLDQGIGTALLNELLEECRKMNLPARIHVEKNNPAMNLYVRLGFKPVEDQGVYDLMEWTPKIS